MRVRLRARVRVCPPLPPCLTTELTTLGLHYNYTAALRCRHGCRAVLLRLQALAIIAVISWFLAPCLNMRTAHSAA